MASATTAYGGSNKVYIHAIAISIIVEVVIGLPCLIMVNYAQALKMREQTETKDLGLLKEDPIDSTSPISF